MTPNPTAKKRKDEDFVFTLSDDEELAGNGAEVTETDTLLVATKKRKREGAEAPKHKGKKQKQQQQLKNSTVNAETDNDSEAFDADYGIDGAEDDGALDPEFEFEIGDATNRGVVEDLDPWGADVGGRDMSGKGNKKAVDIDEIISRRRVKREAESEGKRKSDRSRKENMDEDGESHGSEEGMSIGFDDDELLAADGFGMGASDQEEDTESETENESASEDDGSEDEVNESQGDDTGGTASDDDSIATPVNHPDDISSGENSEIESEVSENEQARRKAFFAPEEKAPEQPHSNSARRLFQEYNLSRPILRGLASVGFTNPTPIQRKAIPVALLGKDIVGSAVTGSGKTAAFVVPILERLLFRSRKIPTSRVVILMPTRELAVQCYSVATKLAAYTDITFCQLVGGFSLREQESVLRKRPDVIIATPGRFIDHMRNSASFTVDTLEILVLDEADRMLEDGFADELNEILTTIPKSRQTMLFSATMTDSVDKLIRVGMDRPVRLMVDSKKHTSGTLAQEFVRLRPGREEKRLGYLLYLCNEIYTNRTIIFFRQKKEAHRVRIIFGLLGLKAGELHGSMSQEQRIKSVENFREGNVAFLLATDLASRGLDIRGVETVINYEAPQSHEIYLHRVGRTARAGRAGRACTIAAEPDRKVVKAAVKAGKAQGAKIASRLVEPAVADGWVSKAEALSAEIEEILQEEKYEKQLSQAEMQVTKGENLIKHEAEIRSRPKRTWFESSQQKREARRVGAVELNGQRAAPSKREKKKLSNKDKKRLDAARDRQEGKIGSKKSKASRENQNIGKTGKQDRRKKRKNDVKKRK